MDRSRYNRYNDGYGGFDEIGTKTPNFNQLRARHLPLPINSFVFKRYDFKTGPCYLDGRPFDARDSGLGCSFNVACYNGYVHNDKTGDIGGGFPTVPDMHQRVRNKLIVKARNTPVNLGVALGEYRETAEFLVHSVRTVVKLARDVKRFNFGAALADVAKYKAGSAMTSAANAWLQWTYAVKPLMADVAGSVTALHNPNEYLEIKRIRVNDSERVSGSTFRDYGDGFDRCYVEGKMKASGYLSFVVRNPLLFTADQLGLLNPISVGYELIPFSFVLDWFLPVGDLLMSILPPSGVDFKQGFTTVKASGTAYAQNLINGRGDLVLSSKESLKERFVLTDFPRYSLIVPSLHLSNSRIASAMSLLTQQLSGGRVRR